jgi:hypothetical protein
MTNIWTKIALAAIAVLIVAAAFVAWRSDLRMRAELNAKIRSQEKIIADLDAKQRTRAAGLAQTLKRLDQQKHAVKTPAQILKQLPSVLPLPVPLVPSPVGAMLQPPEAQAPPQQALPGAPKSLLPTGPPVPTGRLNLPPEDLKPLYDFAIECQACQARLAAAQADLSDERSKTAALSRERDDALRAARGGSPWRRIGRAAKWFAIGAVAGAVAAKAAR